MRYVAFLKQSNDLVFVGDSRIRNLYYSLVREVRAGCLSHNRFIILSEPTDSFAI